MATPIACPSLLCYLTHDDLHTLIKSTYKLPSLQRMRGMTKPKKMYTVMYCYVHVLQLHKSRTPINVCQFIA